MAYVVDKTVWNRKGTSGKRYHAKYLVEFKSRKEGQKHLLYLGMASDHERRDIYHYLGQDDLRAYFVALEQKERIRKVLEFFLQFNGIKDAEGRSGMLIEKAPYRNLLMTKRQTASHIQELVLKHFNNCGWTEKAFFENVRACLPYLWNRVSLRGKKSMSLDEFRKVVGG